MKAAKITVAGTTYFLVMDGEAMFTIRDIYGGTRLMLEKMEQDTREGFLETCNAAAILAERGELVRRRLGYEPGRIPERDDFALLTQPYEIVPLKRAIANAIKLGYKAVGGEFMLLLLPIIYYEAKRIILDFVADFVELYRRAED